MSDVFKGDVFGDLEKAWGETEAADSVPETVAQEVDPALKQQDAPEDQVSEPELPEEDTAEPAEEIAESAQPALSAPASWTAEAKAEWAKTPTRVQQEILKREKDAARGIEEKGREANFARSIRQVLEPYKDRIKQFNTTEPEAIKYLLGMEEFSQKDPEGYILHAAQGLGVNLSALVQRAQQQPQQQTAYNPHVAALERKLAFLEQNMTAREQEALQQEIARFSTDKPYFEDVRPLMATLLESGQAQDLQTAYDMAVRANPDTFGRTQQDQRRSEASRKAAETRAKAEKAKQAAVSVKGAPASSVTSMPAPENLNGLLGHVYDEVMGRAS